MGIVFLFMWKRFKFQAIESLDWINVYSYTRYLVHLSSHFGCKPVRVCRYGATSNGMCIVTIIKSNKFTSVKTFGSRRCLTMRALVNLTHRHLSVHNCFEAN